MIILNHYFEEEVFYGHKLKSKRFRHTHVKWKKLKENEIQ